LLSKFFVFNNAHGEIVEFNVYPQQNVLQTPKHKLLKLQIKKHYFCIEQKHSPTIAQENTKNKYQGICIG